MIFDQPLSTASCASGAGCAYRRVVWIEECRSNAFTSYSGTPA
nr:hypothetical protein [Microtetraspora sp. AC03309]